MTQTQKQNVPKLRFPGFEGDWENSKLGQNVVKVGSGVTPKGGASVYQNSGIPLLRSQNVRDSFLDLQDVAYISDEIHESMSGSHVHDGDVLLNITGASIGRSCVAPKGTSPANVNQHVCIIRLDRGNAPEFIQTILASPKGEKQIFQSQAGGGREGLNFENIRKFKINLPTLPEQRKIASFLGAVDTKIAHLSRKKALLEDYKKGCMQQLFSQKIRFKDDDENEFPDWEEKQLGEVAKIQTGKKDVNEGNPNGVFPFFTCAKQHTYSDSYSFDTDAILIAGNGEVGHCLRYSGKFEAYQRTYVLSDFKTSYDFIYVYMSNKFTDHVLSQKQMGAMPYIKLSALKDFPIPFPHPAEQRKIADFLSALDRKIDLVAQELTHARSFKAGLLQQMFV